MGLLSIVRSLFEEKEVPALLVPPPRTFFLELTNHCNLRCSMCNFHSPSVVQRRSKGFMLKDLSLRLLNEIASLSPERPWVALHGAGEPLLHRDLPAILEHGVSLGLDIGFLTNASLLTPQLTAQILEAGISWIGFSIDGIDRDIFNKYRCGGDYDRIVGNTLGFLEQSARSGSKVRTMVNMTLQEEMKPDIPEFVKFWADKVDEVCVSPFRPVGSRDNALSREFPPTGRVPCYMLSTMMVVFWDGEVALCCEDWFNDGRTGSAVSSSLREIWSGPRFTQYRRLHENGKFDQVPLCGDCNSWYNATPILYTDEVLQCSVRKTAWQYTYVKNAGKQP